MADKPKREKLAAQYVDLDFNLWKARESGIVERDKLIQVVLPHSDRIVDLTEKLLVGENGGGNGDGESYEPTYPAAEKARVLALPKFPEFAAHLMALTPYVFRFFRDDPKGTTDLVYELIKRLREQGVGVIREFLINGSRKPSERYIFDALPWQMVKRNKRRVIDFTIRNNYYFECCQMIDRACQYWETDHRATLTMDRYNYDIFKPENNVQNISGYRSPEAELIKQSFAIDYLGSVIQGRKTLEGENEPAHHGDHYLGLTIARNTHDLFTAIRDAPYPGLIKIEDFWTCSSGSEFAHAGLVEPHEIIIGGQPVIIGDAEICPRPGSRKVKPDYHGQTTLDSVLKSGFASHGLPSAWWYLCSNEDGGAEDGDYEPLPWAIKLRVASYEQLTETCTFCISSTRDRAKNWFFTAFMMSSLSIDPVDGIPKETYDLDRMQPDIERIKAYTDVRLDMDEGYECIVYDL